MTSNLPVNKVGSSILQTEYDFDPDGTAATDVGWVAMKNYLALMISFFRTVGISALTFNIIGNTEEDGSGTDYTIKSVTLSAQPDAVGDVVRAEVLPEELAAVGRQNGVTLKGVSASLAFATGTDEGVVIYTGIPRRSHADLTGDAVA